jgi:hypothetical protein
MMSLVLQYIAIAVACCISAAVVLQKQWPQGVRRMRIACAVPLVRDSRPAWLRKVGKWIAPAAMAGGAGCDSGCDGCSSH